MKTLHKAVIISILLLSSCLGDEGKRFFENELRYTELVGTLKDMYDNYNPGEGRILTFSNCVGSEKVLPTDLCEANMSKTLDELGIRQAKMVKTYCAAGDSAKFQISFIFFKSMISPTSQVVYDECDELLKEESNFVEIEKLRPFWYMKTDSNFP